MTVFCAIFKTSMQLPMNMPLPYNNIDDPLPHQIILELYIIRCVEILISAEPFFYLQEHSCVRSLVPAFMTLFLANNSKAHILGFNMNS